MVLVHDFKTRKATTSSIIFIKILTKLVDILQKSLDSRSKSDIMNIVEVVLNNYSIGL